MKTASNVGVNFGSMARITLDNLIQCSRPDLQAEADSP